MAVQPAAADAAEKAPEQIVPTWDHELDLHSKGYDLIAGVDEAGRGAWAGPLVAAAVVFPHPNAFLPVECTGGLAAELDRLRDSKLLSACVREELLECVRATALALGVGVVSSALIDVIGVGPANRLAMARAVRDLGIRPQYLLLDAFRIPTMPIPQRPIIKGDATCMSIAAASVVAKVARDRIMCRLGEHHPGYSFDQHKGYGTRHHVEALLKLGISPQHRRSYAPIKAVMSGEGIPVPARKGRGSDLLAGEGEA
jgi:ribonuclease HII